RRGRRRSQHVHLVVLDHGIGQELVGGLLEQRLGLGLIGAIELDVEHLALAHRGDAGYAERAQRTLDGLALRVEDAGFERDGDAGFHDRDLPHESAKLTGKIRLSTPKLWANGAVARALPVRCRENGNPGPKPPVSLQVLGPRFRGDERSNGLAFHQDRAGALRALALAHDAEALGNLGIGLDQPAHVAAEAVLVELLVRLDVPQPARIGADLVGDDDAHDVVFPKPSGLHLEVDEPDADAEEQAGQKVVDADRQRHDVVDLLGRSPAEGGDVLLRHHRVVELVVLVVELDDRARQLRALVDAEALRQRARGDVAHHDLERNDLDLANQLLAHVEPADEVRRYADLVEMLEDVLGDSVVEHALAFDHIVLLGVEGGRIVLEMLNQRSRLRAFIEDLRLAFIDSATAAHWRVPWFVKVHSVPWLLL